MIVLKSESDQAVVFFTCENDEIDPLAGYPNANGAGEISLTLCPISIWEDVLPSKVEDGHLLEMNRIIVKSEYRRQGVGNLLMDSMITYASKYDFTIIGYFSPYGDMKLMDLKRWFNSKDFILLENNIFILFP